MAKSPQLVVKIIANTEELIKNLEAGRGAIELYGPSVAKMQDTWARHSAQIVEKAALVTASMKGIGVSTLSAKDAASNLKVLEAGMAQLTREGKAIPPLMKETADSLRTVGTESTGLTATVKQLALGFAAMFTVRAAFSFVKDVIADASALKDLAQQTHINVEELQILAGAMSEFGVDADTLGKGLFTLSRKIAGGDDSVADALGVMGMSLKDVEGLKGEELFLKIMKGLSTLQGGLRDDTAAELFGSRLGMAMAGASEGIEGALEETRRLSNYMSTEAIDALDKYDESIARASRSLSAMAANMIGPVAEGFNALATAMGQGATKWDVFVAMAKDWAASNSVTGASTTHLATLLDGLNQKTTAGAVATRGSTEANQAHVPSVEARTTAERLAAEAAEKLAAAWEKATAAGAAKAASDAANATGMAQFDDGAATLARAQANLDAVWQMNVDHHARLNELKDAAEAKEKKVWDTVKGESRSALQEMADTARDKYAAVMARSDEFEPHVRERFRLAAEAAQVTADAWGTALPAALDVVARKVEETTQKVTASAASWTQAMTAVAAGAGTMTGTVQAAMTDQQWKKAAADAGGSVAYDDYNNPYIHLQGVNLPGRSTQKRAAGGPVAGGQPYMVGERGPELFVPGSAGNIVPNGAGGGISLVVHVDARESFYDTPASLQRLGDKVGASILASLRSHGKVAA